MIKIDPDHGYDAVARIELNGLQASFGIRCRLLDLERLRELQEAQAAGRIEPQDYVQAWLLGWNEAEVRDAADQPMAFTPENLKTLLRVPGAAVAMARAFYSGYQDAVEKNSGPLPAIS